MVQDLILRPHVVRFRRVRWLTPAGKTIKAPLSAGKRAALVAYAEHLMEVVGWRPGGSPSSLRVSAA